VTTATLEAARMTATAARIATSGTLAAATLTAEAEASATMTVTPGVTTTATATPTLAPEWGVDRICECHVPPLAPGSPECERLKAAYVATIVAAWATQTALARGTDTPTLPPSVTPSPTLVPPSATPTPLPTDEPTPTPAMPPTHTPTVTLTPWPDACTAGGRTSCRVLLPFAYLRRAVRR